MEEFIFSILCLVYLAHGDHSINVSMMYISDQKTEIQSKQGNS